MSMVCISAGHNPDKKGASFNGFYEHDEAWEWAMELVTLVSEKYTVDLVPTGALKAKVDFINTAKPDLAMEIHFNSAVNSEGEHTGSGSETLYYPGSNRGMRAAKIVQSHLSPIFSPDRGVKEGYYQLNPSKPPDYFLRKTNCLSLIVEPEFIHKKVLIQEHREAGCKALNAAISEILELISR